MKPGDTLGPYRLLDVLGVGGMGEVYRARDVRLDRDVAIKVLPPHLARDAAALARFEREARAISHLSHPHICTLYDIGCERPAPAAPPSASEFPSPGAGEAVHFLVMEFLEGQTLAQRLARGATRTPVGTPATSATPAPSDGTVPRQRRGGRPLPLADTLRIGTELAQALAAAHKAGIVHRDLKPGNVMLTASGVKVLDFGLAKLHVAEAAPAESSVLTHAANPLTDAGTRLGTVPYMAPEQVEGKEADARGDVFALGAILYEMATGRRAFEGDTTASVAAAILDREPEPVSVIEPLTPPAFEHVVSTCLAKDPEARWQAAGDVARQLRWIASPAAAGSQSVAVGAPAARRRNRAMAIAGVALTAAVAGAGLFVAGRLTVPRPAAPGPMRFSVTAPAGGTVVADATSAAISPDGRRLVLTLVDRAGVPRLWIRPLDTLSAQPLPGTENALLPFWSPDSRFIAFFAEGKLRKVPAAGGPRRGRDAG